ncbi:MAG: efflux RND transporter permease subunit [Candidatus Bipolaricaulaceae bacterium]
MPKPSFFTGLGKFVVAHPLLILFAFAILVGSALYYIREFPIRTSYLDLLPAEDPLVEKYESVQAELSGTDVAAILLSLRNPPEDLKERARLLFSAADRIIAELNPTLIARASYYLRTEVPLPPELLVFRTLYPEERERLAQIVSQLKESVAKLAGQEGFSWPQNLPEDPEELDRILGQVVAAGRGALATFSALPEIQVLVAEASELLRRAQSRVVTEDLGQPLLSTDLTKLVIQVWPTQPVYASQAFNRAVRDELLRAIRAADLEGMGIEAGLTGGYVVSTEVEDVIRRDMAVVTVISTVVVLVLTFFSLGNPVLTILAILPVLASGVLTLGWAKLAVHGFNLLTSFIPALILGLGIDYSIHLLSRFSEAWRGGLGIRKAVEEAVRTKGKAAFVAAATTTAVFCCLLFSRTRALWELGAIMSLGVFISFFTAFLLGPALLVLLGKLFPAMQGRLLLTPERLFPPYRRLLFLSKGVIFVCSVIVVLALAGAPKVEFKFVSGELAPSTPGRAVLTEILESFGSEIWLGDRFQVFVQRASDLAELSTKLSANPLVQSVVSARSLLPTELLGEAAKVQELPLSAAEKGLAELSQLLGEWPDLVDAVEKSAASFSLVELQALLQGRVRRAKILSERASDFFALAEDMGALDPKPLESTVAAISADFQTLKSFAQKLQALPPEDQLIDQIMNLLPQEIRSQYRISRGYILEVRVRPELYEGRNLQNFLSWLKSFGLDYVGSPEIQVALERYMRRDFFLTTGLALLLIFAVIFADLRRPGRVFLALTPLAMGYVCMLGGMAALKLRFNFTNIVISPLLVGYGADGAVYLLHRFDEERAKGREKREGVAWAAAGVLMPILGSYLTTMASFGALLAAQTPGLRFLGISALLGLGFTVLWTALFLPAAMSELQKLKRGTKVA